MPNSRHSTAIFSPSSSRAMNLSRSSIWLHSFQGTFALLAKGPVCTHVSGMNCHPSLRKGIVRRRPMASFYIQHDTSSNGAARRPNELLASDEFVGLHLLVNPDGARYWRVAYRY